MADFSVSFHEDSAFNLDHDNRKYLSKNIAPERVSENISYAGYIPMQEFYEETFQKAYEEYIQKQIKGGHGNRVKNWPEKYYDFVMQKQVNIPRERYHRSTVGYR
jgi:polysaccharide pyruvyl transferase WcaK-like protein